MNASPDRSGEQRSGSGSRTGLLLVLVALVVTLAWAAFRHGSPPSATRAIYDWDFGSLWKYRSLLISGLGYTLLFTLLCVVFGLGIGVLTGLGRLSRNRCVVIPLRIYVEVFRCTPVLVQLVWIYYALPVLTGIEMSEAGTALGLTREQVLRRIVLPQAFRKMVPPLMNQSIMQLKNTSLLSVLAVPDLLYQGQVIAHDTYRPLEIYTLIAIAYFAVLLPVTLWSRRLESASGGRPTG